jgi:hypothetical protein
MSLSERLSLLTLTGFSSVNTDLFRSDAGEQLLDLLREGPIYRPAVGMDQVVPMVSVSSQHV